MTKTALRGALKEQLGKSSESDHEAENKTH